MVGLRAAIAAGAHPYPSRTRKLSPPAFRPVLECESLWKHRFAAHHSYFKPTSTALVGFLHLQTATLVAHHS